MTHEEAFNILKSKPVFIRAYLKALEGTDSEKIPVVQDLIQIIKQLITEE